MKKFEETFFILRNIPFFVCILFLKTKKGKFRL